MSSIRKADYIEFNMIHLLILFVLIFHSFSYYYWSEYRIFIDENIVFIFSEIELLVLYIIVVIVPFISYIAYLIVTIIKHIWEGYTPEKIKKSIIYFRRNYVVIGFSMVALTFITKFEVFHWSHIIITSILLILLNVFYKRFRKIEIDEINLNEINITPIQIFGILVFIIVFVIYLGNDTVQNSVNETYNTVADPFFNLLLITSCIFAFFWAFIKWIASAVSSLFEKYKENLFNIIKFIFFAIIIYFFSKMVIFNLPRVIPEPYPTMCSIGVSGITTLITRKYSSIKDWFWKRKKG